jgi:pyroglutamyl-peptidase
VNPSWEIARALPDYIPALRAKDPALRTAVASADQPRIRLHVHPEAIRVNYQTVRDIVPTFWDESDGKQKYDYALHIGMAGPPVVYAMERRSFRDGYVLKDVDGHLLHDETRREKEGDKWVWDGMPWILETDMDVDDVYGRWRETSPVRCSPFCQSREAEEHVDD